MPIKLEISWLMSSSWHQIIRKEYSFPFVSTDNWKHTVIFQPPPSSVSFLRFDFIIIFVRNMKKNLMSNLGYLSFNKSSSKQISHYETTLTLLENIIHKYLKCLNISSSFKFTIFHIVIAPNLLLAIEEFTTKPQFRFIWFFWD